MGLQEELGGQEEERQCVVLHVAAALLARQGSSGEPPKPQEVTDLAWCLRKQLWKGASDAQAALGDAPPGSRRKRQCYA